MTRPPSKRDQELEDTTRIMGALVRVPPKPHEQMKLGKRTKTTRKKRQAKERS
jgi:hypothetical protein